MRFLLIHALGLGTLAACGAQPVQPPSPLPTSSLPLEVEIEAPPPEPEPEPPLVAAVRHGADGSVLILGLWTDGRLVWSEDPVFGGPPFLEAQVEPERLPEILHGFARLFDRWPGETLDYRPSGASHVELVCTVGGRDRRLSSWHESFERNPEMIVTEAGVERLDQRRRQDVLAAADPDYRRFRVLWKDVRYLMHGMIPADVVPSTDQPILLPAAR